MKSKNQKLLLLLLKKKKLLLLKQAHLTKGNRRYWVHPINLNRKTSGLHSTLIQELRNDPEKFRKYLRMTPTSFDYLLNLVKGKLSKQNTNMRESITAELKLMATLHHLAEGTSHTATAIHYRTGRSTMSEIISDTCVALWEVLQPLYLKPPSGPEEWRRISNGFERWNFPHCIGAIDGKHVIIQKPHNSGSNYWNYKQRDSIVLMAICDADYKFILVDIGQPGSCSDGGIWESSAIGCGLEQGRVNLPPNEPILGNDDGGDFPYMFVADEAFPLRPYIMRPFPGRSLDCNEKRLFNYRLSRARRVIENCFGILSHRFRILFRMIVASPKNVTNLIRAMVVLHNFLRTVSDNVYTPPGYVDTPNVDGNVTPGFWRSEGEIELMHQTRASRSSSAQAVDVRDRLVHYFSNSGAVDWQEAHVNRR